MKEIFKEYNWAGNQYGIEKFLILPEDSYRFYLSPNNLISVYSFNNTNYKCFMYLNYKKYKSAVKAKKAIQTANNKYKKLLVFL